MSPITTIQTPEALAASHRNEIVQKALIATHMFTEKFYRLTPAVAPTSDAAIRAEKMYNDPTSPVYGSLQFVALTEATTGEKIRLFADSVKRVVFQNGVVVVPTEPEYGKRIEDGYDGITYVTSASIQKGRTVANYTAKRLNDVLPMSSRSCDWRPATQAEIETVVDGLIAAGGLKFVQDVLPDLDYLNDLLA